MLTLYDYIVIGFYFVFMAAIGWVCRKFIGNTSDYFRGGGKMLWWMVGCSGFVVQFSAWTFTGAASKAYQDGSIIMVVYLANALGFFINFLYFAPRFRQMRVITSLQAVRQRFGRANEQFFTWVQIPNGLLTAGVWLGGLSIFISAAFGVPLGWTILGAGTVVVMMAVIGGSWAVAAGDFIQTLVLMPITLVAAFMALAQVGGWHQFLAKLPHHHLHWQEGARPAILYLWIIAFLIKGFTSTSNMTEASRYLNAKDGSGARKAALLSSVLFVIGPIAWFIPPMVARITHPDLHTMFPGLKNPSEGAFVAAGLDNMPAGMLGLLISGIFGATMSNMDVGLNRNAGFFVKNFYQVVLRPAAHDRELLLVGKLATLVLGVLVILVALLFSTWHIGLFSLMNQMTALIGLPYCLPLIWGMLIKRAPAWAGWTTVLVGFIASLVGQTVLTPSWIEHLVGWTASPLSPREQDDWALLVVVLLNVLVCSAWFLGACFFGKLRGAEEQKRVEAFFTQMNQPVNFAQEIGDADEARQYRTLGLMALTYGAFISLLVLIPNSLAGRLGMSSCAGVMLTVGGLLYWKARRLQAGSGGMAAIAPSERRQVSDNRPACEPAARRPR